MSLHVLLTEEAQEEFDEAFDWYEGLSSMRPSTGTKACHRRAARPSRRRALIYRRGADSVIVLSVFHTRQDQAIANAGFAA